MDILALASMKNVAKCDTWCELQNPVNHRVFERKMRSKPSGRGHVCLADLPCVTACRSVLTCGGEFNSRHIVRRSGQKYLDDPRSSMRPQSGEASSTMDRAQVPWKGVPERVRDPSCPDPVAPRGSVYELGCLGMQPQSGGKFRPRLNMGERPMANKYREVGRGDCFVEPSHRIESSKWAIFGKQNWRCGMNQKPGYGAQLGANLEPT
ncbi:unnamed protein product [Brassica napus]|uniref:(rape) hypothetical protein n=1 Tax=Brassica napus TaxID=3708 RepID=A0A816SL71_BRANA|nr:unnamed protein product [Brassica napus]